MIANSSRSLRPDLSNHLLLLMLAGVLAACCALALWVSHNNLGPGTPVTQSFGIAAAALLLLPALFSILKRIAVDVNTPAWFVIHALSASMGLILAIGHCAGGRWWSAPGLLLAAAFFLVIQGTLARALLASRIGHLFAASTGSFNFGTRPVVEREKLAPLIQAKQTLLQTLSPANDEGTFSITAVHWLRHPFLSGRYAVLAMRERRLVGARRRAGHLLAWWRPLHLFIATLFFLGILVHAITALFFAGYVAGNEPITWWHFTAWGRP